MRGPGIKKTKKIIGVDSSDWIPGQARDDKPQARDGNIQALKNHQVTDDDSIQINGRRDNRRAQF